MTARMVKGREGWASADSAMRLVRDRTQWGAAERPAEELAPEVKTYPRLPRHTLPSAAPLSMALGAALTGRRSALKLDAARALPVECLTQLLRWSAGTVERVTAAGGPARVYPSAGARYPLEVYVAARAVSGIARGVYHWHAPTGTLEELPVPAAASDAVYDRLEHPWHCESAAVLVVTGRRLLEKYGPRGYHFAVLEAGAVLQNFGLVAAALGLGGSPVGTAWDGDIEDVLRIDREYELALVGFAVGWSAEEPERPLDVLVQRRSARNGATAHVGPVTPAAMIALDTLSALPLWPAGRPPAFAALEAAQGALGVRLGAECPSELLRLPVEAWSAYPRVVRLRACGLRVDWRRNPSEADEPLVHAFSVTIGGSRGGSGVDAFSAAAALEKAIGEAVERYLQSEHACGDDAVVATPRTIDGEAIALDSIAGYATELRARDADRFSWTADTPFRWVRGASLLTGRARWVPLQLVGRVAPSSPDVPHGREPELRPRVSTGLAAHPDRTAAILNAVLEVIERDAFMLTWLARLPARRFALESASDPRIADVCSRFSAARLDAWAVRLATDAPVPVVLGVIHDPSGIGPELAVGASARSDEGDAVLAALTEAYATWRWTRKLMAAENPCPADPATMRTHERLIWWAQPGRWASLRWLIEGPNVEIAPRAERAKSPEDRLERLAGWLRAVEQDAVVVDLTDEAMAYRLGHHVVRVIVPGLHPLHLDEAKPARWSRRLFEVPPRFGFPAPRELNPLPHPFP